VISTEVLTEAFVKDNFENGVSGFHGGANLPLGITMKMDAAGYYETLVKARRVRVIVIQ
jgi:hypothetical protein